MNVGHTGCVGRSGLFSDPFEITAALCYDAVMKNWNENRAGSLYVLLMGSFFLLAVSPLGYRNIAETKTAVFYALTGLYLAAVISFRLRSGKRLLPGGFDAGRLLIAAYWLWSLISALCSPWKAAAFLGGGRCDGMVTITLYCAVFCALGASAGAKRLRLWILAAAAGVYCLIAVLQFMDLNPLRLYPEGMLWSGRETAYNGAFLSFTGNADLSASVLCLLFAVFWSCAALPNRRLYLLPAAVCLGVLAASGIRGGLVGALGGLILCLPAALPLRRRRRAAIYALLAILFAALLLAVYLVPVGGTAGELRALLRGQAEDSFGSGRVYIWKNVWRLVRERPLLGGGADTLGFRGIAFEKTLADGSVLRRPVDCAHCEYLNILVNQGAPALLLLLAAAVRTLVRAFRSETAAAGVLRAAFVSCLITAAFGISMPANSAYFWIVWGLLEAELHASDGGTGEAF